MLEYIVQIIAVSIALIAGGWYCRRWGYVDGYAEGYEDGRTKGLLEGADIVVSPALSGGPRERA